jgi:pimeloyl-ACP methyl ester carboxylesterase
MTVRQTIAIGPGLRFDALSGGPADAPFVLLLHGFAETFHTWQSQIAALAAAGYRAIAPSQRGYSPGARPDTADASNYEFDKLVSDAMAIAAAVGPANRGFHLVGHDWGGSLAWGIADCYPGPSGLARHPVASTPQRIQQGAGAAGRRPGAPLAASSVVSRPWRRCPAARRRFALAARAAQVQRRAGRCDRAACCPARRSGNDGGGADVVPRARRDPHAAWRN